MRNVLVLCFTLFAQVRAQPVRILDLVRLYFKTEPALSAYFCYYDDAITVAALSKERSLSVEAIAHHQSDFRGIDQRYYLEQTQRIGIFVDARCPQGMTLLAQNSHLFNATFTWLVWTNDVVDVLAHLNASRISLDSRLVLAVTGSAQLELTEVYKAHVRGPFIVQNFSYSSNTTKPLSFPPRNDLNGYIFSVTSVLNPSEFPFKGREDEEGFMDPNVAPYAVGMRRYSYTIMFLLSKYFNFDFKIKMNPKWHILYPNGTVTGMLKDLVTEESDFAIAASKYISSRLKITSFLGIIGTARFMFVFRQPIALGSADALLVPMSAGAWFGVLIMSLVSFVALYLALKNDRGIQARSKISETFLATLSALSLQAVMEIGSRVTTQIVVITVTIMAFLVNVLYNSSVLNGLIIKAPDAIQNMNQLLESDIKFSSYDIGYLHNELKHNDSITTLVRFKLSKSDKPFCQLEEGIKLANSGKYALFVFFDDFYRLSGEMLTSKEICSTSSLLMGSYPVGLGGVRDSPYGEHFRRGLGVMHESGIASRLLGLFRAVKPDCAWTLEAEAFGYKPLTLAYITLLGGLLLSVVVFIAERLYPMRALIRSMITEA